MAALLLLVCLFSSFNQIWTKEFTHSQHLHHSYLLEWNYDEEIITMRLTVESTSWIGFGLSTDRVMAGADIIMGGVKHGQGYLIDAHALKAGPPVVDDKQDVTLLDSSQIDGVTSLTIKRKLKTGGQFDMDITAGDLGVIWAYGFFDLNGEPKYQNYHFHRRGEAQVNFLTGLNEGEDFKYSVKLRDDEDHKDVDDVILQWFYTEEDITFKYTAPSSGWIGFGFSPDGMMTGSDIIIGGIDRDERYIYDSYATKSGPPKRNEEQDVEFLKVNQDDYVTTIIVRRKLKTGDAKDMDIKEGKMHIIWAYGKLEYYKHLGYFNYHGWNRGTKEVELIQKKIAPPATSSSTTAAYPTSTTTTTNEPEQTTEPVPPPRTEKPSPEPDQPRGTVALDADGEVQFFWSQDGKNIIIAITAPTSGWIGVGFSPGQNMAGADLIISGSGPDNRGYILDAYATENGAPMVDDSQDATLLMAFQNGTSTRVMFERKMTSPDVNDFKITSGELYVLWAYGAEDPVGNPTTENYHGTKRGAKKMTLVPESPDWP